MGFGINPNTYTISPAQILADEAQRRQQALQAQQIALQRRSQNIQAEQFAQSKELQAGQFDRTLAANEASAAAEAVKSGATEAFNRQKYNEEPGRQMALEAYRAKMRPKSIDEQIFEAIQGDNTPAEPAPIERVKGVFTNVGTAAPRQAGGGFTRAELMKKLGMDIQPRQPLPGNLEPSGYDAETGQVTYARPAATAAESATLKYTKEKDTQKEQQRLQETAGKLKMALAAKGFPMADKTKLPVTAESMRAFISYSGQDPDDPMWQSYYTQAEAQANQLGTGLTRWQRNQNAFRPKAHEIKRPGKPIDQQSNGDYWQQNYGF